MGFVLHLQSPWLQDIREPLVYSMDYVIKVRVYSHFPYE